MDVEIYHTVASYDSTPPFFLFVVENYPDAG